MIPQGQIPIQGQGHNANYFQRVIDPQGAK